MKNTPPPHIAEQIAEAYITMVEVVKYAPAAASDGWGNLILDEKDLDHTTDSAMYATNWWTEETEQNYHLGCPDHRGRPALIHTVEAARLICSMNYTRAARMLRLVADELDNLEDGFL